MSHCTKLPEVSEANSSQDLPPPQDSESDKLVQEELNLIAKSVDDQLKSLADRTKIDTKLLLPKLGNQLSIDSPGDNNNGRKDKERLVNYAAEWELFKTSAGELFCSFLTNEHQETWPLRSQEARLQLLGLFYKAEKRAPSQQSLDAAVSLLECFAQFGREGEKPIVRPVFLRVAGHNGCVYQDLCSESWDQVKISKDGYQVVAANDSPVRFRRAPGMMALPHPAKGGSLSQLRRFTNLDEAGFKLFIGSLIDKLRPGGHQREITSFEGGGENSGKSTAAELIKRLVDPSVSNLSAFPATERDLYVHAQSAWILGYDNVGHLESAQQDWLCRVTGPVQYVNRTLYTNEDVTMLPGLRPVLLTAIDRVITRGDSISRTLSITPLKIEEHQQKDSATFWAEFEDELPQILGALYEAVSATLNNTKVNLLRKPRLTETVIWVAGAEMALCKDEQLNWGNVGTFCNLLLNSQKANLEISAENDELVALIVKVVEDETNTEYTVATLLEKLKEKASDDFGRSRHFPTRNTLRDRLTRLERTLQAVGIECDARRKSASRKITLRKITTVNPSCPSQGAQAETFGAFVTRHPPVIDPSYHDALMTPSMTGKSQALTPDDGYDALVTHNSPPLKKPLTFDDLR